MTAQHMLSHLSKKRDKYGLLIVKTSRRIGLVDESRSEEDMRTIATWNIDYHRLILLTKKACRHIEEVVFMLT